MNETERVAAAILRCRLYGSQIGKVEERVAYGRASNSTSWRNALEEAQAAIREIRP